MQKKSIHKNSVNYQNLERSKSSLQHSLCRTYESGKKNNEILTLAQKLSSISHSMEISVLGKNRLNLIQYEKEGQKSRHDPQMILAKLRKLQNRAEIHRADLQLLQIYRQHGRQKLGYKKQPRNLRCSFQQKNENKKSYLKIYEVYMRQKQLQNSMVFALEDENQNQSIKEESQPKQSKNGIKYISLLKKHPRLLEYTVYKKKQKQGIIQKQMQIDRKSSLKRVVKELNFQNQYQQQRKTQKKKELERYIQNPQKVIQKQMAKFYLKKNPGKLSKYAMMNQRSLNLIERQNQLSCSLGESSISKQNRTKMKHKFNEIANQIAKSDMKKSLQGLLPLLKLQRTLNDQNLQRKKPINKALFNDI